MNGQLIHELYAKTGYGMLDCKKALQKTNGDIVKAEEWLKEWKGTTLFSLENRRLNQ